MATSHFTPGGPHSLRTRLYLDTARLGQMSPGAASALQDLVRLTQEEGCSLAVRTLLHRGFSAWPRELRCEFPGLATWQGTRALKSSIRTLLGLPDSAGISLAARSAELVRAAVRALAARVRCILLTDLTWPAYRQVVQEEAKRLGATVVIASVRALTQVSAPLAQVAQHITAQYEAQRCDALFLPAVSHDGIRLPLRFIHRAVSRVKAPAFFLVDGAQQIAHAPLGGLSDFCDFYVAGSHKWLRGRMPVGIGAFPRRETREVFESAMCETHDPLLAFTSYLEAGGLDRYSETVNLFPLFSCQAALSDVLGSAAFPVQRRFQVRLRNARLFARSLASSHCQAVSRAAPFRSGIVLVRLSGLMQAAKVEEIEGWFAERGIAVTAYDGGLVRLSMPDLPLSSQDLFDVTSVLAELSDCPFEQSPSSSLLTV